MVPILLRQKSERSRAGPRASGGEVWRGAQPWPASRGSGQQAFAAKVTKSSESASKQSSSSDSLEPKTFTNYYELFAAAVGNVEWLRFCLDRNQGESRVDDKGFTAIHCAAQRGKLACLQVLIEEYSFPVDLLTESNQTPLHLVIHRDNRTTALSCIHYLLQKGADISIQTCDGHTPLHLAAREGLLRCVKVLVQRGADVHTQDATGCKAIDYCKIWNRRACARFLKDAMWKQDKKDFAREMGKLKRLQDQLVCMEKSYLIEHQKERRRLREAEFRKWLRSKLLHRSPRVSNTKQEEAGVPLCSSALSSTPRPKNLYPSVEARLQNMPQPVVPPPKPIYRNPPISRPKRWNLSNNPASSPTTDLRCPQGVRVGTQPEGSREHSFRNFLEVKPAARGGARLLTEDGRWVAPVPKLPYEVILRVLYPGARPFRMKVPQGFYPLSILRTPQKRHWGSNICWTNALAMNLCDTFDETFLATLRDRQALPCLPSSQSPP